MLIGLGTKRCVPLSLIHCIRLSIVLLKRSPAGRRFCFFNLFYSHDTVSYLPSKYTTGLKQKEREEKEARLAKLRPAIRNMLKGNPNVFHYSTFRTADKLFSQHPIWQQAKIESERKLIFEEYVAELKEREVVRLILQAKKNGVSSDFFL
jgi:hypothetical protein